MTIRHPYQPRPIWGKHGKTVEMSSNRQAFQARSVIGYEEQMKTWSAPLTSSLDVG
jgi:hypothetical protein